MIIDNCDHEKVVINFNKCNGCEVTEEFLNYLSEDDKRLINEQT